MTIVLYGSLGDSGEWRLDDEKNNFERGKYEMLITQPKKNLIAKKLIFFKEKMNSKLNVQPWAK